jgi:hypothetical protein
MRALCGQGTPREAAETLYAPIIVLRTEAALVFALIATVDGETRRNRHRRRRPDAKLKNRDFVNGLLRQALRSHPSRRPNSQARRPPPDGYIHAPVSRR